MNIVNNLCCPSFTAKLNIQKMEKGKRNWANITKIVEEGTKEYPKGTIELISNKKGLLDTLCFDNRYIASLSENVGKAIEKWSDKDFADSIIETYKDWIFKINCVFK